MFRVVERSKLSLKFGNETFMDCHLSEEEEDEFVAETRTILLDVDDDFDKDDFDDFEENTTGGFVTASNILNKSAKLKDARKVRVRLLQTRVLFSRVREEEEETEEAFLSGI